MVALKVGSRPARDLGVEVIADHLSKIGYSDCLVIVVEQFDDLTILNEAAMNGLGWQRIPVPETETEDG